MKISGFIYALFALSCLCACEDRCIPGHCVPDGMVEVGFSLAGQVASAGIAGTKAGGVTEADSETLASYKPVPLPSGTTLWIMASEVKDGIKSSEDDIVKSYVVREIENGSQMLYPCQVDNDGNFTGEDADPMFLEGGRTYLFRAVSPARAFVEGASSEYALYVDNKEYVISSDERYKQTKATEVDIPLPDNDSHIVFVKLNPMINQTAQLEFEIVPKDEHVHIIEMLPQGVKIYGLQNRYSKDGDKEWNWSLGEPLRAYIGNSRTMVSIRPDNEYKDSFITRRDDGSIYIKCPVLPTDASSSDIIVSFSMKVNGIPTVYTMSLSGKIFDAAHTYRYKGMLDIKDGVNVITWQYVYWYDTIPVIPPSKTGQK